MRLSQFFSDHMVLQRDVSLPVWGWAQPNCEVVVRLAGQTARTHADRERRWRVMLATLPAGGPHELSITSGDAVVVRSALVTKPRAVRYTWHMTPEPLPNLVNRERLPAVPFHTRPEWFAQTPAP